MLGVGDTAGSTSAKSLAFLSTYFNAAVCKTEDETMEYQYKNFKN